MSVSPSILFEVGCVVFAAVPDTCGLLAHELLGSLLSLPTVGVLRLQCLLPSLALPGSENPNSVLTLVQ